MLTFNYTQPFTDTVAGPGLSERDVINIHGRMDGDVIFGIDGKRYDALQRGMNIVRMKNGQVKKVWIP